MKQIRMLMLALVGAFVATVSAAQSSYQVRSGDTLVIEVLEDETLNRSVIVLSDGRISFPFAGTVRVEGRTVGEIEASIASAIESKFATRPNVFVTVQPRPRIAAPAPQPAAPIVPPTIDIFFLGEVNTPGTIQVEPGTRFLQAMARSGGLTRFAADKRVQLRRTNPITGATHLFEINYRAILDGAHVQNNVQLEDGDVIIVPERRLFE